MADGALHSLSVIPEESYGITPADPVWDKWRITGTTLGLTKSTLQSEEIRDDRQPADTRLGTRQVGGEINGEMSANTWDDFLEALLGGTWEIDNPAPDTDVLKAGVIRRSFSMLRHFSDMEASDKSYFLYTGVEANSWTLNLTADAVVTHTMGFIGQDLNLSTAEPVGSTYTPPTTSQVMESFTGTIAEGGTEIGVVTEVTLTVENGIEPRFVVGSKLTIHPSIKRFTVTGQMTAYFETTDLLDKFMDESTSSMTFSVVDLDGNTIAINLPNIVYTGGQPDVTGDGPITLVMPFTANYSEVTGSNLVIHRS